MRKRKKGPKSKGIVNLNHIQNDLLNREKGNSLRTNFCSYMVGKNFENIQDIAKYVAEKTGNYRFQDQCWKYTSWFQTNFKIVKVGGDSFVEWKVTPKGTSHVNQSMFNSIHQNITRIETVFETIEKPDIKDAFYQIMVEAKKNGITYLKEQPLIKKMAEISNTKEWSCNMFLPSKWTDKLWFRTDFVIEKQGIRWRQLNEPITNPMSYNTPDKAIGRDFVFQNVSNIDLPIIATNGSWEGLDVDLILSKNSNAIVHYVESNKEKFKSYAARGFNSLNYNMKMEKFLEVNKSKKFDIVWLDYFSMYCKSMSDVLNFINQSKNIEELNITVEYKYNSTPRFKTTDKWNQQYWDKFGSTDNPQKSAIEAELSNYDFVDMILHNSSHDTRNINKNKMMILKFKLK